MHIIRTIDQTREAIGGARDRKLRIGLVPTMGALHEGHVSLIERCRSECGYVVVSIFVNPTQFSAGEDLSRYPRPFEHDCQLCERAGVDLIFAPTDEQMYPQVNLGWVNVEKLGDHLCGTSRPGHFRGVCTVVAKLFNIVRPDAAYFGQKDAQQLAIIRRMVADLNFPVAICPCPTVREADGLAMSSRNRYLNAEQRREALCLSAALREAERLFRGGQRDAAVLIAAMAGVIGARPGAKIDYISIVDNELMQPITKIDRAVTVAMAVKIGPARLIDNIVLDPAH